MRIQLVLADDWELRGDGSGDMRAIQFGTLRRLTEIYERHGLRGSFNAEVMQQLAHRRFGADEPELAALADEWEQVVRDAAARGHDFQLHLHPQWSAASRVDGRWSLDAPWSMLEYDGDRIRSMVAEGKRYLESVVRAAVPGYRCVSYRSGSWALAPHDDILPALAENGIVIDISMSAGLHYDSPRLKLDYRSQEEDFVPYHPRMDDARRLSDSEEPIVCVPPHGFPRRKAPKLARRAALQARRLRLPGAGAAAGRWARPNDTPVAGAGYEASYAAWGTDQGATAVNDATDIASLSWAELRDMLRDIRRRAAATGWDEVPVVIENHTKDIGDFGPIERLAAELGAADDIEVVTLSELAAAVEGGRYPVRRAATSAPSAAAHAA